VKGIGGDEKREQSTYQMYWDYREPLSTLKHHRVLAINRGEREGELDVSINIDDLLVEDRVLERVRPANAQRKDAVTDGLARLLCLRCAGRFVPTSARTRSRTRSRCSARICGISSCSRPCGARACSASIRAFGRGTKCAALDETGKFLDYFVINQETKPEQGKKDIARR